MKPTDDLGTGMENICTCVHTPMHRHGEAKGIRLLSFSIAFCLEPWRQDFSVCLKGTVQSWWLVRELLGSTHLCPILPHGAGGLGFPSHACFFCDSCGFKPRFSGLHSKCSYPLGHPPSSHQGKNVFIFPLFCNDAFSGCWLLLWQFLTFEKIFLCYLLASF